jgi:general secretion pathway protein A
MYKEYYGLHEYPFGITTDTKFFYWSRTHQNAFRHLLYSQQSHKSLIALAGEVGTGKTTLLNAFVDAINASSRQARIAYVANSNLHLDDLYRYIFHEFGLEVKTGRKSEYILTLKDFLSTCFHCQETPLLILDESQNYPREMLEEIRLLSNLGTPKENLLQIVLAGQPQLVHNINQPDMYQLKQRISVIYTLQPLNYHEIIDYIDKRLEVAGAKGRALFSEQAIADIYRYSKGIPRVINLVCDNTLLYGYAAKSRQIDATIVKQVAEDMHLGNGRVDARATKAVAPEAGERAAAREDAADKIIITQTRKALQSKAQNPSNNSQPRLLRWVLACAAGLLLLAGLFWSSSYNNHIKRGGVDTPRQAEKRTTPIFEEIAGRFSKAGEDFAMYEPHVLAQVLLRADLEAIRARLTTLEKMPLTSFERQGVAEFARQEKRLRTALNALTTASAEDPSPTYSAAMINEIKHAIAQATEHVRRYR